MNQIRFSLRRAMLLLSTPLLMLGCSSQPSHKPAPVVQPAPQPISPTISQKTEVLPTQLAETTRKAELFAITAAPPHPGGILPPVPTKDDGIAQTQIKQAQAALRKVVVLLPDRPSLSEVNRDIEKGIRAAHQQHPHNAQLQLVFIHDALTGEALIHKAKSYAPDWIIGPLTKADIQSVQSLTNEQHIFLNQLDTPSKSLQMGLAIEDEIDQLLAEFQPNQGQIAVIASNDAVEQRLLADINTKAKNRSLTITTIPVEKQNPDIREWLLQEGGLQASQDRVKRLTQLIKADLSDSTVKTRNDIQGIIFLGNAKQLRSIMPSVQYFQVSWPIYATSRLLPSVNATRFNEPELNGVNLLVPPYLLTTQIPSNLFEALGWDSYLLLGDPQAKLAATQTGKLTNQDNRLKRQLLWQHIEAGQLVQGKRP